MIGITKKLGLMVKTLPGKKNIQLVIESILVFLFN